MDALVEDPRDARVLEPGQGRDLPAQGLQLVLAVQVDRLQGDVGPVAPGAVHHAHRALAKGPDDLVGPDALAHSSP